LGFWRIGGWGDLWVSRVVGCGFDGWVLILTLRLMSFDFNYDFFKLIGYVVVDGGWWWLGLWWYCGGWVDGNRLLHAKPNNERVDDNNILMNR